MSNPNEKSNKEKNIANAALLAAVGIILVFPLLFFNFSGGATAEKRNLAVFPKIFNDGKINKGIFKELEKYVDDRFGGRDALVSLNAYISLYVLKTSPSDEVLLGKNDWLFYISKKDGDNLSDFLKTNKFTDEQLLNVKNNLQDKADWCTANGIEFLFVVPPNKHNIYPEYYSLDRPEGETRLDQVIDYLHKNSDVRIVDLRQALLSDKKNALLYKETDTHWNSNGAYGGYKAIRSEIEKLFPNIDFGEEVKYKITSHKENGGDLISMLGVKSYGSLSVFDYKPENGYPYVVIKDEERAGVITAASDKNSSLPKAVIFRDSYFIHLQPFVSSLFSEVVYNWKLFEDQDKDMILNYSPDIVIFEILERYMDLLVLPN